MQSTPPRRAVRSAPTRGPGYGALGLTLGLLLGAFGCAPDDSVAKGEGAADTGGGGAATPPPGAGTDGSPPLDLGPVPVGGNQPLDATPQDGAAGPDVAPTDHCFDYRDPDACSLGGCHWWASQGRCHDQPSADPCDQSTPAMCAAAGCVWVNARCETPVAAGCEGLREAACTARPECRWSTDHCELDPSWDPCESLTPELCGERADCYLGEAPPACHARPGGLCETLGAEACALRPDCQAVLAPPHPCDSADAAPGCPLAFERCEVVPPACETLPADLCETVPGCSVATSATPCPPCECPPETPDCVCAPCPAAAVCVRLLAPEAECPLRSAAVCEIDLRCRLTADLGCLPAVASPCADLSAAACEASARCHVEVGQACLCAESGEPDTPPGGCVCVPQDTCRPNRDAILCEALREPEECTAAGCVPRIVPDDPLCRRACEESPVGAAGAICPAACRECARTAPRCEYLPRAECLGRADCVFSQDDPDCQCVGADGCPCQGRCADAFPAPAGCAGTPLRACEAAGCAVVTLSNPCPACEPDAASCPPCPATVPGCVEPSVACGLHTSAECALDHGCALDWQEVCAPPLCPVGEVCVGAECGDRAVCRPADAR